MKRIFILCALFLFVLAVNAQAHSQYPLTAKDITEGNVFEETDFDNQAAQSVNEVADLDHINDTSNDNTEFGTTKDPYAGDSESRPVVAAEEIQTLRYAAQQRFTGSEWYTYQEVTIIDSTPFELSQDVSNYIVSSDVPVTLNLLPGVGLLDKVYRIFNKTTPVVTIDGNASETINGTSTILLRGQYDSVMIICDSNSWYTLAEATNNPPLPRSYLAGLQLANDTDTDHDVLANVGEARDSTDTVNVALDSIITKQIDATWAEGDDAGGLFNGTVGNDTWYHVFAIVSDSVGTIDVGYDDNILASNIPAGYTYYRRLGAVLTNGSANILGFTQLGDEFLWDSPPEDVSINNLSPAAQSVVMSVPTGLKVISLLTAEAHQDTGCAYISSLDQDDESCTNTGLGLVNGESSGRFRVRTNTGAQVRLRGDVANTPDLNVWTLGWLDARGRDD